MKAGTSISQSRKRLLQSKGKRKRGKPLPLHRGAYDPDTVRKETDYLVRILGQGSSTVGDQSLVLSA